MRRVNLAKAVAVVAWILMAMAASYLVGLRNGAENTPDYRLLMAWKAKLVELFKSTPDELLVKTDIRPVYHLQPLRHDRSGVTVNDPGTDQSDLILLSGFFDDSNALRLMRRDGSVVAQWPLHLFDIFSDLSYLQQEPQTEWNIDTHGALALPDGSVVVNFEYVGMVKLDRCGAVQWTVPRQTHHSVERSENGGFWVPGRRHIAADVQYPLDPFEAPLREDTILKIGDDGTVLKEISVPVMLYRNGLETVLTANGDTFESGKNPGRAIVHLNMIDELKSEIAGDFPMFEAGDLALSLRDHNMVLVADPDTEKVKWYQIGPWRRQHHPQFVKGGKILLFNNNLYETAYREKLYWSDLSIPRISNIMQVDISANVTRIVYGGTPQQELLSVIRGKIEARPNGGLFITEFEGGRVFEVDGSGKTTWEFVNRYDEDDVAEITTGKIYPVSYFRVPDWSCGQRRPAS